MSKQRIEYGDWQTNYELAKKVCDLLKKKGVNPYCLIEPTCGEGSFICAALDTFDTISDIYAIEIYKPYIDIVTEKLSQYANINIHIFHEDVFSFNFSSITVNKEVLIIGNPPWITNSHLGELASENLPAKTNFKKNKGLEAITGKGNFDIAEYILLMLLKKFSYTDGHIAMLVKNSVIKNIIQDQSCNKFPIGDVSQYEFNAVKEFGAATSASLFYAKLKSLPEDFCDIYDLYTEEKKKRIGLIENKIISNLDIYHKYKDIDGKSPLIWRSGLKHDCSKIMELKISNSVYLNDLNETIDLEPDLIYPLLKSSDIKGEFITAVRKYVIVTQKSTNDDTSFIEYKAPKTYKYLQKHSEKLDGRKSSIYKNRPRFCIFGIGDYSFMPYKVIISALYNSTTFSFVGRIEDRPVMLDDTCYLLGFEKKSYAIITQKILNGVEVQGFIKSISFPDAKRMINKDLLMRIDLYKAAKNIGYKDLDIHENLFHEYLNFLKPITLFD